jgi:LysR family glycine cleavage system transcriptional activator
VYSAKVDVCVRYGTGIWPGRVVSLLSDVMIFPVCSPAMINGPRGIREVSDLQGHALLCEDDGSEWTRWLLAAGAGRQTWRLVPMGNAHVAIEAALHGQGIALADTLLDQVDLEQGRLVRLFDKGIAARHAYYLVHREEVGETPAASAFIGWLQGRIQRDG